MNRPSFKVVLATALALALFKSCKACSSPASDLSSDIDRSEYTVQRDLEEIKKEGVLRAAAKYSSTSYFIYRGRPMGFEYELLTWLADDMNLDLEIYVENDLMKAADLLNEGKIDIIAYGLTVTMDRKNIFEFTEPYYETTQVLVQLKPKNWRKIKRHETDIQMIRNVTDLIGKTIKVRKDSSYYRRLKNLSHEIGGKIFIEEAPSWMLTEDLIKEVAENKIEYTVSDKNIAVVNKNYYPDLDIETEISFPQRIAWAVRKNSPSLKEKTDSWIKKIRRYNAYHTIYNKYYRNRRSIKTRGKSEFHSKKGGKISRYDELIKNYAKEIKWDWRLLASMIYQESRFNPESESWAGASGLMQLMPGTSEKIGVIDTTDPHQSIWAGTFFIKKLQKQFSHIKDKKNRIKFVLASYNTGKGHVDDAMRLAEKHGLNSLEWENTSKYLLKLSSPKYYYDPVVKYGYCRGTEPYNYVIEVLKRYEHYKKFISPHEKDMEETETDAYGHDGDIIKPDLHNH